MLTQYVIYRFPADAPGKWVTRAWHITREGATPGTMWLSDSLDEARTHVPEHLVRLAPSPDDDPVICEIWT